MQFTLVLNLWSFPCSNLDVKCSGFPRCHPNSYSLKKDKKSVLDLILRTFTFCDGILRYWKYLSLLLLSLDSRDISRGKLFWPRVGTSSWLLCSATSGIWLRWDGSRQDQDCHSGKSWEEKTGDSKARTARRNGGMLLWSISRLSSLQVSANFSTDARLENSASGQQPPASRSLQCPLTARLYHCHQHQDFPTHYKGCSVHRWWSRSQRLWYFPWSINWYYKWSCAEVK